MPRRDLGAEFAEKGSRAAEAAAEYVGGHPAALGQVLRAAASPVKRVKNGAAKTLILLARRAPAVVHDELAFFRSLLDHDDSILRWTAMDVIGHVAAVDRGGRIRRPVLERLIDALDDPSMVTAAHAVDNLGRIAEHKPRMRAEATKHLLRAHRVRRSRDCRQILAGRALVALARCCADLRDPDLEADVRAFARRLTRSPRASTRRKAAELLGVLAEKD